MSDSEPRQARRDLRLFKDGGRMRMPMGSQSGGREVMILSAPVYVRSMTMESCLDRAELRACFDVP